MIRVLLLTATLLTFVDLASATSLNLLCGLSAVVIDMEGKSVTVLGPQLDIYTGEYVSSWYKDGNKYEDKTFSRLQQITQYVWISEDIINFGQMASPDKDAGRHYKIDRRTGLFVSSSAYHAPTACSVLSARPVF